MDTGRLTHGLWPRTRSIVFPDSAPDDFVADLETMTTIDLAHVTMLAEQEFVRPETAAALLREIRALRMERFASLVDLPTPRGMYLMYESELVRRLGPEAGGTLQTGRSRNDLNATATAMRLRTELLDLLDELARLRAVLLSRSVAAERTVMPVYTHYQAAMPITYGYHLTGVAIALGRECDAIAHALDSQHRCPLGAGAVAGTDLPIDTSRTASLLGFDGPPVHATDAVASRDVALRGLAAVAGAALVINRLGTDLQLWSTAEFGFLTFPDRLMGSSSAMPQKRNAFLLEHIKAKAGMAIGAWTTAATTMKSAPFTNAIEVGTEAMDSVWPAVEAVRQSTLLTQVMVSGARPVTEAMMSRAEEGFVTATALANQLVQAGIPFRSAHHAVGEFVRKTLEEDGSRSSERRITHDGTTVEMSTPSMPESVAEQRFGGGPGAAAEALAEARSHLARDYRWRRARRTTGRQAERTLAESVDAVIARGAE